MKRVGSVFKRMVFAAAGFALAASACSQATNENSTPAAASSACDPTTAQILIGDGFQEIMCGCQEPSGQAVMAGSGSVTCTVDSGKAMLFYYLGTRLKHQVVPTDGTSFPSSKISDPVDQVRTTVHAFTLTRSGSFGYVDAFDPGVNGTIVAR